jgi:hypothetical protein
MVDEFLAKASISQCSSFAETADVISKVGFKMFLGVNVEARPPGYPPHPAYSTSALPMLYNAFVSFTSGSSPAQVAGASESEFRLQMSENPLAEFVELPEEYAKLEYSGMLCGVLRGALEMVQMRVECTLTKDVLWGDDVTEIHVVLKERLQEEYHDDDD